MSDQEITRAEETKPQLVPSLTEAAQIGGLQTTKLGVAIEANGEGKVRMASRDSLWISDGEKGAVWKVESLRALFRGDRKPPADIEQYPAEYCTYFYFLESHLLVLCDYVGDLSDQELEEIYSTLRRRPDGRSVSFAHDFLWQVCALLLGSCVLSQAEFEGILGALIRSTRKWGVRPVSRNYMAYLRNNLGGDREVTTQPVD
jgi:hypothetical protein